MISGSLLGLVGIILVHSLGLGELVDFSSNESGEQFLGKGMGDRLAYVRFVSIGTGGLRCGCKGGLTFFALMVLKQLHALKGSTACDELMGELGLVIVATAAVDLLVRLASVV